MSCVGVASPMINSPLHRGAYREVGVMDEMARLAAVCLVEGSMSEFFFSFIEKGSPKPPQGSPKALVARRALVKIHKKGSREALE